MKFLKVLFAAAIVMVGLVSIVGCAAETEPEVTEPVVVDDAEPAV